MSSPKDRKYIQKSWGYNYALNYRRISLPIYCDIGCYPSCGALTLCNGSVFGETRGNSLSYIHTLILTTLCQRRKVSGPQRITVPAILRQQRDSLHHATQLATLQATSRSRGWTAHAPLSSSQSPSISINSSLVPNGSVSSTSATGGSSSPSKPPE